MLKGLDNGGSLSIHSKGIRPSRAAGDACGSWTPLTGRRNEIGSWTAAPTESSGATRWRNLRLLGTRSRDRQPRRGFRGSALRGVRAILNSLKVFSAVLLGFSTEISTYFAGR